MKKRFMIIACILSMSLCFNVPVMAKDIDDMTLEELKVEYLKLQLEYEKLKASVDAEAKTIPLPQQMKIHQMKILRKNPMKRQSREMKKSLKHQCLII